MRLRSTLSEEFRYVSFEFVGQIALLLMLIERITVQIFNHFVFSTDFSNSWLSFLIGS